MRGELALTLMARFLEASPIAAFFDHDAVLLEQVALRMRRAFALQGTCMHVHIPRWM